MHKLIHTHTYTHVVHNLKSSTRRTNMKTFSATKRIFLSWYERQSLNSHLPSPISGIFSSLSLYSLYAAQHFKLHQMHENATPWRNLNPASCLVHPATTPKAKATEVGQLRQSSPLLFSLSLSFSLDCLSLLELKERVWNPFCVNKIVQLSSALTPRLSHPGPLSWTSLLQQFKCKIPFCF